LALKLGYPFIRSFDHSMCIPELLKQAMPQQLQQVRLISCSKSNRAAKNPHASSTLGIFNTFNGKPTKHQYL